MKKDLKVVLVGLGYIGLPTAALIASKGIRVQGVDINQKVVDTVSQGKIHIVEPDLDGLVKYVVSSGFFKADIRPTEGDVFIIAVPTPFKGDHEPDLSYVEAAAQNIVPFLKPNDLFIIESTSPVGTTEHIYETIIKARPELHGKIHMAYCPERVLPGNVIFELVHNDRVIGGMNEASTAKAMEFYALFVNGQLHKTNARTAEMCKLVENSFRDVNIAFANELSMISAKADINVWELIQLANRHPRVKILQPGPGVGGHCIAVDPWFIVSGYPQESKLIKSARQVNNYKAEWVFEKIAGAVSVLEQQLGRSPKIACLGLAFKPNIDDLRESPALHIVEQLIAKRYNILAVEPNVTEWQAFKLNEAQSAVEESDLVVVLVKHRQFNELEFGKKPVLDFCGLQFTSPV